MLADTDVGNVVVAAQAGAQWGYRMLPLLCLLIPLLYMLQELSVRLGVSTGRGHGELIRDCFGQGWAWLSVGSLAVATIGSLITQFTGIASIGEWYGVPRVLTLSTSVAVLLAVVATGTYQRTERVTLLIGLFELAFFAVAWAAHPDPSTVMRQVSEIPLSNRNFLYFAAAIIGAVLNPWMVYYQQAVVSRKCLTAEECRVERRDTACGAVLTQLLTASVLVAAAATLSSEGRSTNLSSIGEISVALSTLLGGRVAQYVFNAGVLGAAMVAAIISTLALAWGVGEISGHRHTLELNPFTARWFYAVYAASVTGAAALVGCVSDLVRLNIAAQVLNAFLAPLVVGFLVTLATKALPEHLRLRGPYRYMLIGVSALVCGLGVVGALAGF
jgi:Mn2+/Fe2+ NRAMP family transporter